MNVDDDDDEKMKTNMNLKGRKKTVTTHSNALYV